MKRRCFFCSIFILSSISISWTWKFGKYPKADLNIVQLAKKEGYPIEEYELMTDDNYLLTTYRIPHGRSSKNTTNRSPVLLLHGLSANARMFVLLGSGRAMAFYFADEGFDVWIMNARGTPGSQKHKCYDLNTDRRYWNFDFHHIAIYDTRTNIDFIINKTKQKPFLIGHSQGTTCQAILPAVRPEYNEKIKISVMYGPALLPQNIDSPVVRLLSYIVDIIEGLYRILGMHEVFPYSILPVIKQVCREQTYFMQVCALFGSILGSHESELIDKHLWPVITGELSRISSMQLFHYMQIIKTGKFMQYDYGVRDNIKIYKRKTPPKYNLKKLTSPVAIFYAERDDIVTEKGAIEIIDMLPNVIFQYKVPFATFNHLDFLFGSNASALVYQPTVELFRDFDEGRYSPNATRVGRGQKRL